MMQAALSVGESSAQGSRGHQESEASCGTEGGRCGTRGLIRALSDHAAQARGRCGETFRSSSWCCWQDPPCAPWGLDVTGPGHQHIKTVESEPLRA